jgi:methylmalonyl-CoA mutase N-terminal domain/subunit
VATAKEIYETYLTGEKPLNYKTLSGIELKEFYTADDVAPGGEVPGEYPFTRGIHRDMYRRRFWTRRQQSGFGTPKTSNERFKFLLGVGETGLNVNWDVGTKLGVDPDYPLAQGDIGLQGASASNFEDMEELFADIPLDEVSSTLIIQPPYSIVIMAMYVLMARKRGIPEEKLIGTVMNCPMTQLVGPNLEAVSRFFPVRPAIDIGIDVMEYCIKHMPRWNIVNINAYNIRECGVNAVQEAAFAFSIGVEYVQALIDRGLNVDDFARRIGFFSCFGMDFLEEIAKLRAMRRLWAKIMRERFGAKDPRSCFFRTAIQTAALPLTAQQPLNNIARTAIQTLGAVLAGTQSIHTTGYDEAYSLPTEESHKLSVRIQQIVAYETNVVKSVDPLGGSYTIEHLTDQLEEKIVALMRVIEDRGGFVKCFEDGWVENQLNEARYKNAKDLEDKEVYSVGVNIFHEEDEEIKLDIFRHSQDMQLERIKYITEYKKNRDQRKLKQVLDNLYAKAAAEKRTNLFLPVMEAVEAGATMQEVIDVLRKVENFQIPK